LNSEFDVIETAQLFLNSSHGVGAEIAQTGINGPSIFPTTALAARVRVRPTEPWYIQTAVYDAGAGDPENPKGTQIILGKGEGVLGIAETSYVFGMDGDQPYGKIALGGWVYSAEFDDLVDLDGQGSFEKRDNYGIYGLAEYQIFREGSHRYQGLSVFVRVGMANEEVNQFDLYTGGGLVYTGLISGRDEDQVGLAVAVAHNGDDFRQANPGFQNEEIALEGTYRIQVNPWMSVQPDVQYIINPTADASADDAFVIGTRVEVIL